MLRTQSPSLTFILDSNTTDHRPVPFMLDFKPTRDKSLETISIINYDGLDNVMEQLDFTHVFSSTDTESATNNLITSLSTIINKNTAVKIISKKHKILKPWISPGLLRCKRNRDHFHKQQKADKDNTFLRLTYIRYRNFCNKLLKKLKRQYDTNELKKAGTNIKCLWDIIKRISNTKKTTSIPNQLLSPTNSPKQSCNSVNTFFVNIGKTLADNIRCSPHPTGCSNPPPQLSNTPVSFVLLNTDENEVIGGINSLRPLAATGWDGISPTIIKKYSLILAPILTHIFNLCFQNGFFPSAFKKAIIHPIFKSGDGHALLTIVQSLCSVPTFSKLLVNASLIID